MKSCRTCPSFSGDPAEVNQAFGKAVGLPMCLRFGSILGAPDKSEAGDRQVQMWHAHNCENHGEPRPATPVSITPRLTESREEIVVKSGAALQSCNTCSHYIRPTDANAAFGSSVGLCSVKGTLVLSPVRDCRSCEWANEGVPLTDMNVVKLMPEYAPGFRVDHYLSVQAMISGVKVDPSEYDSDIELTDEDKALGIAAWRLVEDPEGEGKPAAIPIFREDAFDEADAALVPALRGGRGNPELYLDHTGLLYQFAVDSIQLDETLCLVGEPGTGKTEAVRYFAWACRLPFSRFTFTEATEVDDAIGKYLAEDGSTVWHDGQLTERYRRPGLQCVDELNTARDELRQFFRPMMDNDKAFVLNAGDGVEVVRDRHHRLIVAVNPAYDFRNIGTKEFAGAEVSRMSFAELGFPPDPVVKQVVQERCRLIGYEIPSATMDLILRISEDFREASANGSVQFTWQLREIIKVARKTKFYGIVKAFRSAVLDYVEPGQRELAMTLIEGHIQ